MPRITRAAVAVVLTLTFAAVPLVVDWCAASCEAARGTATATTPACHHAGSSTARLGHVPAPCGQGHHPVFVDAAATRPTAPRALAAVPALVTDVGASAPRVAASASDAWTVAISSPTRFPLVLSSALRI